jgi:hypothetical protein
MVVAEALDCRLRNTHGSVLLFYDVTGNASLSACTHVALMCVCVCVRVFVCLCLFVCMCVCVCREHEVLVIFLCPYTVHDFLNTHTFHTHTHTIQPHTHIQCTHIHKQHIEGGSINVPLTSCLTGLESAV